jgi:signal transduction protein with GAF and PtsI domain
MTGSPRDRVFAELDALLGAVPPSFDAILAAVCARFDCAVGTVHLLDQAGVLQLCAARNLPPVVLDKVRSVPIGKGMAGIAAERREPVQVCNLQSDASGVVRPGAKMTRMEGSLAAPMLEGDRLAGVLGVAKPVEYEFSAEESALLMAVGTRIAQRLGALR